MTKEARTYNGEDGLFNKQYWENWTTTCIKGLNVRSDTIKLLEENIGKTHSDINHSRILYDPHPRILEIKAKTNKNLYIENYKTLMKESRDDTNRWRSVLCS